MISSDTIHELLLTVWGRQACQNPDHWPDVLTRLMKDYSPPDDGTGHKRYGRASLKPAVDAAVDTLAAPFADGVPTDAATVVWSAFPKLTRENCVVLAQALIEAAGPAKPGLFDDVGEGG
jgi:hypothetical protein